MKGAQFYSAWAAAAVEASRLDEAEELYHRALKAEPDNEEAQKGLTRLKIEFHGGEGAFAHYERAAQEQPSNPKIWFTWSRALGANRRTAAALEVAERGLAANPASKELMVARAFARGMIGDASAALDELDSLLRGQPKISPLQSIITQIAFRAGRPERAAEVLELQTAQDPGNQIAWSLLGLAWRMLDDPREHWLCDYDKLVMITEVTPLDGSTSAADYAREIAAALDPLHLAKSEPGDQSLRGGTQSSGSLFARMDRPIQRFRDAVRVAAEKAVSGLPDDPTHPFLSRKSIHLGFSGSWSIRLAAGGHHVSHCHPDGWMSSAFYSRLPPVDKAGRGRHEGWIQFGCAPPHLGVDLSPRRIVEPQPGRLVLFPSYMWHGTIPFASGDRLTAAFDYQPL
jgi:tetratricopeptide (TPR) repeat protein